MPTPRGTRDFLPESMRKRRYVMDTIRSVFTKYGYGELESPAFELWDTIREKGGDAIEKEVYVFKDKGERDLALRFDLTVPLARILSENSRLPKPFKRYCIGRVWRYERPTSDRFREFWQADVDIVGSSSMLCEAECLAAASDALKTLGFSKFVIILNSRKVIDALIQKAGIPKDKTVDVIRSVDKLKKIGRDGVLSELSDKGIDGESALDLLSKSGKPEEIIQYLKSELSDNEGVLELEEICEFAKKYGIYDMIKIDLTLARGFDYYTGPIFEISIPEGNIGSVTGGGRYDELIGKYADQDVPAVGISIGIERVIDVMDRLSMFSVKDSDSDVFIAPVNSEMIPKCVEIATELRSKGVSCEIELKSRKLGKQFQYVDSKKIPKIIIVGPKEVEKGIVKIRDMKTGDEKEVKIKELAGEFK